MKESLVSLIDPACAYDFQRLTPVRANSAHLGQVTTVQNCQGRHARVCTRWSVYIGGRRTSRQDFIIIGCD